MEQGAQYTPKAYRAPPLTSLNVVAQSADVLNLHLDHIA